MLKHLAEQAVPDWLDDLTPDAIRTGPFPLDKVLRDSLYYPSAGFDGDPVRYLAGNIHSFIYVDYGHTRAEFEAAILDPGFRGYEVIATWPVTERELAPNGWTPKPPRPSDGDPNRCRDGQKRPYCVWSVFQRQAGVPADHGPSRFSLLYLCADGVAAYQALYVANSAVPKAVAIIQPGHGFGDNWTDFTDPKMIFARTVFSNPSGKPMFMLYGGVGEGDAYGQPIWPEYEKPVCFLDKAGGGRIGIWSRTVLNEHNHQA